MNYYPPLIYLQNKYAKQEKPLNISQQHIYIKERPPKRIKLNFTFLAILWNDTFWYVVVVIDRHEIFQFEEVNEVYEKGNKTDDKAVAGPLYSLQARRAVSVIIRLCFVL